MAISNRFLSGLLIVCAIVVILNPLYHYTVESIMVANDLRPLFCDGHSWYVCSRVYFEEDPAGPLHLTLWWRVWVVAMEFFGVLWGLDILMRETLGQGIDCLTW